MENIILLIIQQRDFNQLLTLHPVIVFLYALMLRSHLLAN